MQAAKQQKTVNRAATTQPAASTPVAAPSLVVQPSLKVSSPKDSAELEADATAKKIMRMSLPPVSAPLVPSPVVARKPIEEKEKKLQKLESPYIARFSAAKLIPRKKKEKEEEKIQRKGQGETQVSPAISEEIGSSLSGGSPLSGEVRGFMEPRFRADFSGVRIHTGQKAASLSRKLNAQAFTVGNSVFFGKDSYRPESSSGRELIAHELTHTIQQGAVVRRSEEVTVSQSSPPAVQRLGISDALDFFADKANMIPGFRMFTIILGVNPINMSRVERSAANILRAMVEFIPGGGLVTQALDGYGIFEKVGRWVEQQIATLGMTGSAIKQAVTKFLDSLGWRDIFNLGDVWNRAKRIFTEPIERIISFAKGLITGILGFIREAILRPLAKLAEGTRGYDLLKAILGQDPVTGDPVPRNADTLIGGFMKLIGQEEVWQNLKKGNAVARAWAWFQGALAGLMGFVRAIPQKIIATITSLTIQDVVSIAGAFTKVVGAFAGIAGQFIGWGVKQVIGLLEILFSVVAPGAVPYIKKAQNAFQSIVKNPIGFVGNLVKAGKLGFEMFAANIVQHLKAALIKWLVGPLADAGVYIPKSFSLVEIVKLVLSVLGLTWSNIRAKLVKIIPEPVLAGLEKTAAILVTLVKDGPAAAWEQIKGELNELKEQLISQITQMISVEVVKAAVMKLVSMLNPAGAVVQAIIAIYNTITFFIQKINQIAAVVASFIDSIAAIAAGQVAGAAKRVEQTMANTLTVVIAFLAKFAGLGGIPQKLVGIVKKIRAPIDRGLDKIVGWLGNMLKKLGGAVAQAGLPKDPKERFRLGMEAAEKAVNRFSGKKVGKVVLNPLLSAIKVRYGFQVLEVFQSGKNWWIKGVLNPAGDKKTTVEVEDAGTPAGGKAKKMPLMTVQFNVKESIRKDSLDGISLFVHYKQQLQLQENKLRTMFILNWLNNITAFYGDKSKKIAKKGRSKEGDAIAKQTRERLIDAKASALMANDAKLSRDAARARATEFYSKKAVLHLLDQGGGGSGTEFVDQALKDAGVNAADLRDEDKLGSGRVDYAIGASWPKRARELKQNIEDRVDPSVFPIEKMNVKLKTDPENM